MSQMTVMTEEEERVRQSRERYHEDCGLVVYHVTMAVRLCSG